MPIPLSSTDDTIVRALRFIGVGEFSKHVGLSRSTIYTLLNTGQVLSVRFGHRRLIPVEEQERFVKELCTKAR
jgi:excisionase family DNA binding protein